MDGGSATMSEMDEMVEPSDPTDEAAGDRTDGDATVEIHHRQFRVPLDEARLGTTAAVAAIVLEPAQLFVVEIVQRHPSVPVVDEVEAQ